MKRGLFRATGACLLAIGALFAPILAPQAMADDSSQGVTPGRLVAVPAGSVSFTSAKVQIKGRHVVLSLQPQVRGNAHGKILLQGEPFGWLGESEAWPDRHFPELQLSVDNVAVKAEESFLAQVGKQDVSALLREAGINPWLIAETPPFVAVDGISPELLAKLLQAGALTASGRDYLAQWRAQRTLSFAADQAFSLAYDLRPGFSLRSKAALGSAALQKRYCLDRRQLAALPNAAQYLTKEYVIPVGVDKQVPPKVLLDVEPDAGVLLVATCAHQGGAVRAQGFAGVAAKPDQQGALHILTIQAVAP